MDDRKNVMPQQQKIYIKAAAAPQGSWALVRGSLVLTVSTDRAKTVEVCNILRGHNGFSCGVGETCCFYPLPMRVA
jgi:hypothetical protein